MKSPTLKSQTKQSKKYKGFTLVELIVVITILVILGTISFLNLSGFQSNARDSVRIENLTNLKKGLDIFQIRSGQYPTSENAVNITASGVIIAYQGFAKEQVGSIAKISSNGTIDPSDSTIYTTYSTNVDRTKIRLMNFLEDGNNVTGFIPNSLGITQVFASTTSDYSKRFPITIGDTLGILLGNGTGSLNQPVQESGTGVDVVLTNTGYLAYVNQKKIISGTGTSLKVLTANNSKNPITYALSCKDINDNGFSIGDGTYYINPTGTGSFQTYCDMTTNGGGWTRVFDYNNTIPLISRLSIEDTDWVQNDKNYSRLYSMVGIKNKNNEYEFKILTSPQNFQK